MAGNIAAAILKGLGELGEGMGDAFKMGAKIGAGEVDAGEKFGYNGGHTAFQGAVEGYTNGLISKEMAGGTMQEAGGAKELFGSGDKSISKNIGENKGVSKKLAGAFKGKSDERLKQWVESGNSERWYVGDDCHLHYKGDYKTVIDTPYLKMKRRIDYGDTTIRGDVLSSPYREVKSYPTTELDSETKGSETKKVWSSKSDEQLKEEIASDPILNAFRQIDAIIFRYNDEAQRIKSSGMDNTGSIDTDIHAGVKAQDLEKSDLLKSAVSTGPDGYKEVDIKEMTLANTAAISELTKKLDKLMAVINV